MTDALGALARANIAAVGAILLVLLLRGAARRYFGARTAYNLWAVVPVSMLASMFPALPADIRLPGVELAAAPVQAAVTWSGLGDQASSLSGLFISLWMLGVAVNLGLLLWRQRRFVRVARAGRAGPAVLGVFLPRLVVPSDFETRFTDAERRVILAHERIHLSRNDPATAGLIALLQCLNWFNPLVHLAGHLARLDQELACDADVMTRFPHDRRTYAEAMLKTQLVSEPLPFGCYWPTRSIHPLEERIAMLNRPVPGKSWRVAGAALVAALMMGTGYAALGADVGHPTQATAGSVAPGLSMRLVDDTAGAAKRAGNQRVATQDGAMWLKPGAPITRQMVADAAPTVDRAGHPLVRFRLTPNGARRFAALTNDHIGQRVAILVNGRVLSAPLIKQTVSGGAGEISGHFSPAEAKALAVAIAPSVSQ